jgi:hypothetical protein
MLQSYLYMATAGARQATTRMARTATASKSATPPFKSLEHIVKDGNISWPSRDVHYPNTRKIAESLPPTWCSDLLTTVQLPRGQITTARLARATQTDNMSATSRARGITVPAVEKVIRRKGRQFCLPDPPEPLRSQQNKWARESSSNLESNASTAGTIRCYKPLPYDVALGPEEVPNEM